MENIELFEETFIDRTLNNPVLQNEYRINSEFTDVIIRSEDGLEFNVHKIVIATQCRFFQALYSSKMKESFQSIIQLDENVSGAHLEKIIEFIYTGKIKINLNNAKILNQNAVYLELDNLKKATARVLGRSLNLDKSLDLWRHSMKFFNDELQSDCSKFIHENLDAFFEKFLLDLTDNELDKISSNCWRYSHEKLFLKIMTWVKHDFKKRHIYIEKLMNHVSFETISNDFKKLHIIDDEILMNDLDFAKVILKKCFVQPKNIIAETPKFEEVKVVSNAKNIFVVTSHWILKVNEHAIQPHLEPMTARKELSGFSVCDYNKKFILISGGPHSNICLSYSSETNKILDMTPMKEVRQNYSTINLNNKIYACGGINNNRSVEIYDPENGTWSFGKSLNYGTDHSFGISSWGGSIYTFSGKSCYNIVNSKNSLERKSVFSKIVQRFDPRENSWFNVDMTGIQMENPKCLCINDSIYSFTTYHTANIFEIRQNKWIKMELQNSDQFNIRNSRSFDAIQNSGNIYFFGGRSDQDLYNYTFCKKFELQTKKIDYVDIDLTSYDGYDIRLVSLQS